MTRIYDFTWLKFHILLKKANQKERKDYICLFKQRMMENSIPYNRNYIKLDIYYHIMDKHEYVPRKWFFRLLLNSSKR